ncbi:MAG: hypothetical protein AAB539_03620 [Patescibacteria group bacterium]
MRTDIKFYGALFIASFIPHLVWEALHIRLYGGYESLSGALSVPVWAAFGDALYTFAAVSAVSLFKKNHRWMVEATWREYIGFALMGFFIAVFVEYKAMIFGRWFYLDAMPIIPGLSVGLSPIAQMTILLPFSVYIASRAVR